MPDLEAYYYEQCEEHGTQGFCMMPRRAHRDDFTSPKTPSGAGASSATTSSTEASTYASWQTPRTSRRPCTRTRRRARSCGPRASTRCCRPTRLVDRVKEAGDAAFVQPAPARRRHADRRRLEVAAALRRRGAARRRLTYRSAEQRGLAAGRRLRVGLAHHPERVEQTEQRGEERHEERDLQRVGRASVLMRMISACTSSGWPSSRVASCVLLITSASCSSTSATRSCSAG